ncbi:hypothetical protein JD77_06214 [Micromonospora olivasterospora]|uniref:Uncharacterized protein n=1 Tax=Micromonospora olivasterospora TaxID=1880 RepID=A0A562IKP5_MICOL|nr:hypothetical protein [Micromonospora olivasterospora]TWH71184.1 hypothetical protein JD77_06214 [Micromonospora olivasterospora]
MPEHSDGDDDPREDAPPCSKARGTAAAASRAPNMVTMTMNWIMGRVGSYRLAVQAMRYQSHQRARVSTSAE